MVVGRYSLRADHPADQLRVPPAGQQVLVQLNTPPAKAGGFTVATKVAFRLKPVWPLLKQAEVIPPQFGRFHLHLPVA